jgi:metal-dependent hydrolase (beta-lactamase superfamily II)
MSEKILPNLYRIKVPLPGSPLKATNSYVIKGTERSLIIDTGWNREDCMTALISGLKECGVDSSQADFFVTHMHADHSGLVSTLAEMQKLSGLLRLTIGRSRLISLVNVVFLRKNLERLSEVIPVADTLAAIAQVLP